MKLSQLLINFNKPFVSAESFNKQDCPLSFKGRESLCCDKFEKIRNVADCEDIAENKDTPVATGTIWDKKLNKPVDIAVLRSNGVKNKTTYRFMSKNLQKEYGYVEVTLCKNPQEFEYEYIGEDAPLLKDYPQYGITGSRLIVDYLKNNNDTRYSGIGKLADKIEVKHCLDNGLEPTIISIADWGSHVAHYKRGKRFLPLNSDSVMYKFLQEKYGSTDVNKILEKLIKQSDVTDERVDLDKWQPIPMYLSHELAKRYAKELESKI